MFRISRVLRNKLVQVAIIALISLTKFASILFVDGACEKLSGVRIVMDVDQFNYDQVASEKAKELRELAGEIRAGGQMLTRTAIQIGGFLTQAKVGLRHGLFQEWCRLEAGFEPRTAQLYMNLAVLFSRHGEDVYQVPCSAALKLASPSVDEASVEEILKRARRGERLTVEAVEECIRRGKGEAIDPTLVDETKVVAMIMTMLDKSSKSELQGFLGNKPGAHDRRFVKRLRERLAEEARQNLARSYQRVPLLPPRQPSA